MAAKCPNHDVPLQLTKDKGIGICPLSGYRFAYSIDDKAAERRVDKYGNLMTTFKVVSLDGEDG